MSFGSCFSWVLTESTGSSIALVAGKDARFIKLEVLMGWNYFAILSPLSEESPNRNLCRSD